MKSTQSTQTSPSTGAGSTAAPATVAGSSPRFVELTADSVTDDMIRVMLADARRWGQTDVSVMCSKALRHPATITTNADAIARRGARAACAREINDNAASWLDHRHARDRLYAALVGVIRSARPRGRPPRTQTVNAPKHPLCWECNGTIDPDQEHRIVKLRTGPVSVHLQCAEYIDEAELHEDARDVVAEASALELEPHPDEAYYPDEDDTLDYSEDER